ncbi:MAG: bacteriohemerythrin [Methylomarinum sp.]|nr:bacteriohemerythrin [Methylomarinum sp.]
MSEFIWQKDYGIGHALVDNQHQYLFDLANNILEAKTKSEMIKYVMLLYKYVREHFRAEEALMKDIEYPEYSTHKKIHDMLLDKMVSISDNINQNNWDNDEIRVFMRDWVLDHILVKDKALGKYINQ